ncbi:unnamed protein product [Dovyalis caffra]|uniref:Uncharacterized protein n=1 Tax=Dovyalis caffra TaxID=77055 RepID=A0AAV1RQY3_9ROSI|nr:unnamed protein product [Dovyalis caffra]
MKAISKVLDVFLEKIIDEHLQYREKGKNKDFVDVVLSFMESEETDYHIDRGLRYHDNFFLENCSFSSSDGTRIYVKAELDLMTLSINSPSDSQTDTQHDGLLYA